MTSRLRFKRQDLSLQSLFSKESISYLKYKITCMFGMDYRSLALFRFCMACCVIGDIIERSADLFVLYTEGGVMPRSLIVSRYSSNFFLPVHLINTSWTFQAILFTFHAFIAFLMAIGYRTKLTSTLTWFLTISLQAYNGIVGHGGDVYFRMMLFGAIFVPTAECFAVDSWHFTDGKTGKKQHASLYVEQNPQHQMDSNGGNLIGDSVSINEQNSSATSSTTIINGSSPRMNGVHSTTSPSMQGSESVLEIGEISTGKATIGRPNTADPDSYRFLSFGTTLILLQMSCMYIASFYHKSGEEWHNGEATFYAITLDYFATDIAKIAVQFRTILKLLTISVAKWELVGPLFFYSPFLTDYCRLFGALGFMALHLGFVLCLRLGLFFWVTFTAQTCNIPPFIWEYTFDWLDFKIRKGQRPTRVYYNTTSPVSQYITLIFKTFFILPSTAQFAPLDQLNQQQQQQQQLLQHQNDIISGGAQSLSENNQNQNINDSDDEQKSFLNNSTTVNGGGKLLLGDDWFVTIDSNGVRRRNLMALNHLCSKSPLLFPLASLFALTPAGLSNLVSRIMLFAHTKSQESQALSSGRSVYQRRKLAPQPPHRIWSILNNIWLAWVCYVILIYNLNTFHWDVGWRHEYMQMAFLFRWDQGWNMFSPAPPKIHWWHVIHGKLDDDTPVELFKNEAFHNLHETNLVVNFDKPDPFYKSYGNHRWFKFWENGYNSAGGDSLRLEVGRYICRQFNTYHHGNKMLYSFTVYFVHEFQNLDGTLSDSQHQSLWNHICYEKPPQQQ